MKKTIMGIALLLALQVFAENTPIGNERVSGLPTDTKNNEITDDCAFCTVDGDDTLLDNKLQELVISTENTVLSEENMAGASKIPHVCYGKSDGRQFRIVGESLKDAKINQESFCKRMVSNCSIGSCIVLDKENPDKRDRINRYWQQFQQAH